MRIEFPYKEKVSKSAGKISVVVVWLEIKTVRKIYEPFEFLFDTGADFTSLPKFMAVDVGLDLTKCPQELMYTAENKPMTTYHAKIKIRFGEKILDLPCVSTDYDDTPFLLGRVGFIERFDMHLLASERKLVFEEVF